MYLSRGLLLLKNISLQSCFKENKEIRNLADRYLSQYGEIIFKNNLL